MTHLWYSTTARMSPGWSTASEEDDDIEIPDEDIPDDLPLPGRPVLVDDPAKDIPGIHEPDPTEAHPDVQEHAIVEDKED